MPSDWMTLVPGSQVLSLSWCCPRVAGPSKHTPPTPTPTQLKRAGTGITMPENEPVHPSSCETYFGFYKTQSMAFRLHQVNYRTFKTASDLINH